MSTWLVHYLHIEERGNQMVYGYARVSTKGQAKDGNSLEAQERILKEHNAEVIYMDLFTGTKMERPELNKLLIILTERDTIVVTKLDRFARSVSQASALITELMIKALEQMLLILELWIIQV